MIIIHLPQTDNTNFHILQKQYNDYTTYDKLDTYFKGTRFENYSFHGSYERNMIDNQGNQFKITITRIRITTVDESGHNHIETHAVFFSSMLPYLPYSVGDVIHIANDDIPDSLIISQQVYSSLKSRFHDVSVKTIFLFVQKIYNFIQFNFIST